MRETIDGSPALKRGLGLWLTTFYGLGVVVGAGIYVLIGAIAGLAGTAAPLSFLVAGLVAGVTGFSYMELTARLPEAAGEAAYVDHGFGSPALTLATGLALVAVAILAAATISSGAAGYLEALVPLPGWIAIAAIVAALAALAIYGIVESAVFAALLTVIEVGGLALVAISAYLADPEIPARLDQILPTAGWSAWSGVFAGAIIAFFAFVGFEDMVNVAEEVVEPERTLPRAIGIVLAASTLLYLAVATVAVLAVPVEELAASPAPLALVASRGLPGSHLVVTAIAVAAALNGILVQFIMASRVLYGLSSRGRLPTWFGRIAGTTRTPVNATLAVAAVTWVLAVSLPIVDLAAMSARVILVIFIVVNLALVRIKLRGGQDPAISVPLAVPVLGAVLSAGLLASGLFF